MLQCLSVACSVGGGLGGGAATHLHSLALFPSRHAHAVSSWTQTHRIIMYLQTHTALITQHTNHIKYIAHSALLNGLHLYHRKYNQTRSSEY